MSGHASPGTASGTLERDIAGRPCSGPGDRWSVVRAEAPDGAPRTTVTFLGDVALAGGVGTVIDRQGPDWPFAGSPELFATDILCFNLECCLSERGEPWESKPVRMRGVDRYLDVFPPGPHYVANVANNHFLDYGPVAALDTLASLRARNIDSFGAVGQSAPSQPLVLDSAGGSIAFLAFSSAAHPMPDGAPVNVLAGPPAALADQVRAARDRADVLVVSLHQGIEYSPYLDRASRMLSRLMVEAGADCVICHHTHVVQAVEVHRGAAILHGLGNLLIDVEPGRRPRAAETIVARIVLSGGRIRSVDVEPYVISEDLRVRPLAGTPAATEMANRMASLSSSLRSPVGRAQNEMAARLEYLRGRTRALAGAVERDGLIEAVQYYRRRVFAKMRGR